MFDERFIKRAIANSAENPLDRRRFLRSAGAVGVGVAGASLIPGFSEAAFASDGHHHHDHDDDGPSDAAILNFALNLEYLEAEFYSIATTGEPLPGDLTTGKGDHGGVRGGHKVPFETTLVSGFANEIAMDERDHVTFLRTALGGAKVAQPEIDLDKSFTAAAMAAGLIGPGQTFDPFANESNFLLGAFIFEDVGVTAYKGAAPLINHKTYLSAAAGILAVEAYHASGIRTVLYDRGLATATDKISDARDALDNRIDDDQGVILDGRINIVPSDSNGIAFGRTPGDVLNIVYLTPKRARQGGFFPDGVNGPIHTSTPLGATSAS